MIGLPSLCFFCKRLIDPTADVPYSCAAFPKGIPEAVIQGLVDHRIPIEGDGGTLFEAQEGADEEQLANVTDSLDSAEHEEQAYVNGEGKTISLRIELKNGAQRLVEQEEKGLDIL